MQPSYLSPLLRTLCPYVPGEQPQSDLPLIKLNTNENPYPPSPRIHPALQEAASLLQLYPEPSCLLLRQSIASAEGLSPEQVFVGNGSDEVLALCFPAFFQKQPHPVLFADITYSFYEVYAQLFGVAVQTIPLRADFSLDVAAFCTTPAGGLLLPNPNAPTGLFLPLEEIERILLAHPQCVILVDEAYVAFGGTSAAGLIGRYPNLLVVRTLSKSHALAGLRVGYAMGQPALIEALHQVKDSFNSYTVDRLAQAAARAALEDGAYTARQCEKVVQTRAWFIEALKERGFSVLPSLANFVFASPSDKNAQAVFQKLRAHNVLVRYFKKPRIDQYLRITIGTDEQMHALLSALDA